MTGAHVAVEIAKSGPAMTNMRKLARNARTNENGPIALETRNVMQAHSTLLAADALHKNQRLGSS